jgi:hypothetical protein
MHLLRRWKAAGLLGFCLGCYHDPDIEKIVCRAPEYECPNGYVCSVAADGGQGAGRCCKAGDPVCSAGLDASPDGGAGKVEVDASDGAVDKATVDENDTVDAASAF